MPRSATTIIKRWPLEAQEWLLEPHLDVVAEDSVDGDPNTEDGTLARFVQRHGPFTHYERTVVRSGGVITEATEFDLHIPWFGWVFRWLFGRFIHRRAPGSRPQPWWAPPSRISEHEASLLGLLAAASMLAAFVNTLFTQTLTYSADEFNISTTGQGLGAAVVRWGIIIAIPISISADRIGRRRVMVAVGFLAPLVASLGAIAPNFASLVGTQAIGRPLALTLDLLIIVTAAEEMPRDARAFAVSILAMASGLVAFIGNLFVATASIFQNEYLKDVRGFPAWQIALFTTVTAAPASIGLIVGGRLADARGRRLLAASMIPLGTALLVTSFAVAGVGMWVSAAFGGILVALAYPAMAVYRAELFPTQRRGRAASIITAASLMGGSIGLIAGGVMVDHGLSYGNMMSILAIGPLLVGFIVLVSYPETAHRELEELNPQDVTQ